MAEIVYSETTVGEFAIDYNILNWVCARLCIKNMHYKRVGVFVGERLLQLLHGVTPCGMLVIHHGPLFSGSPQTGHVISTPQDPAGSRQSLRPWPRPRPRPLTLLPQLCHIHL